MKRIKNVILMSIGIISVNATASNDFFSNSRDGYFYYKDPVPIAKSAVKKQSKKETPRGTSKDYNSTETRMSIPFMNKDERAAEKAREKKYMDNIPWDQLDELSADEYRRLLDTTRDISVATPSKQYVKSYAALQKFWIDKSERFAKVWQVANMEDPNKLLYPDFDFSDGGRRMKNIDLEKKEKAFYEKIKSRMGYIVIVGDKKDADVMKRTKEVYDFVKSKTGLEYMIYDYYEVPELARELKIDENTLPDNLILYKGAHGKMIYKRLVNGYSSATQIIYNTKFMFENAILEEDKAPQDKSK